MDKINIKVGARSSPLSKIQVQEVFEALKFHYPSIVFEPFFVESMGDKDRTTSLRTLEKTDFFTREIDALLLQNTCRIAIHSAKDLPDPLPKGLKIAALTEGKDSADVLVLAPGQEFDQLPPGACIATSSIRREEVVKSLREDLKFCDLRGTIHERLSLLEKGEVDGVVVAEAALIRLGLTHLNRFRLPGETTPYQGQLAVVCREQDQEMVDLFACLDTRKNARKVLYLGLDLPEKPVKGLQFLHMPLIRIHLRPPSDPEIIDSFHRIADYTHFLFTSKSAVHAFFKNLSSFRCKPKDWEGKTFICVGQQTARVLKAYKVHQPLIASTETAEGMVSLIESLPLDNVYFFWPHSALSRPILSNFLKRKQLRFKECVLYDTIMNPAVRPINLEGVDEIHFTSPSTVEAFKKLFGALPKNKILRAIGPITEEHLIKNMDPS